MVSQSSPSVLSVSRWQRFIIRTVAGMATLGVCGLVHSEWVPDDAIAAPINSQSGSIGVPILQSSPSYRSSRLLGTPLATNYQTYCQPAYPPQEKPLCGGTGGEVDGSAPASSTDGSLIVPTASLEPIGPYQYDKVTLFPLR